MIINLIFTAFNLFLLIICVAAWHEVRGLQGGYGRGVWAECSTYMMDARDRRKTFTWFFIICTVINVLMWIDVIKG